MYMIVYECEYSTCIQYCVSVGNYAEVTWPRKQTTQDIYQRTCSSEAATDPGLRQLLPAGERQVLRYSAEQGQPQYTRRDSAKLQRTVLQSESRRGGADCATATQHTGPLHSRE